MWNEALFETGPSLFIYFKSAKSIKKCTKEIGLFAKYFCIGASSSPINIVVYND